MNHLSMVRAVRAEGIRKYQEARRNHRPSEALRRQLQAVTAHELRLTVRERQGLLSRVVSYLRSAA